jgi:endoribonuclease Dicer
MAAAVAQAGLPFNHSSPVKLTALYESALQEESDASAESDHAFTQENLSAAANDARAAQKEAEIQTLLDHEAAHKAQHMGPGSSSESKSMKASDDQSDVIIDKAREYQQELFERAKGENVIAVLDTGMGKTLIAAMLIRHTLEQDMLNTANGLPQRRVFFLANR